MKNSSLALFLAVFLLGASCCSQGGSGIEHELASAMAASTSPTGPGGSQVTCEEQARVEELIGQLRMAPRLDWAEILVAAGVALGSMLLLLRVLPNRYIVGAAEAEALYKAAGLRE